MFCATIDTRTHSPHCAFNLCKSEEFKKIRVEAVEEEDKGRSREEEKETFRGTTLLLEFVRSSSVLSFVVGDIL